MSDVPYYLPPTEGPMFAGDAGRLVEETETFLACSNRDVEAEVARQNRYDMASNSSRLWLQDQLKDIDTK